MPWGIFHSRTLSERVAVNTRTSVTAHFVRWALLTGTAVVSVKHGLPGVMGSPAGPAVKRPREDSNLGTRLRRAVLYPLSYGGFDGR